VAVCSVTNHNHNNNHISRQSPEDKLGAQDPHDSDLFIRPSYANAAVALAQLEKVRTHFQTSLLPRWYFILQPSLPTSATILSANKS